MRGAFYAAGAFNQALDWDTSKVTNMYGMFQNAEAFNQPGISDWDVGQVSDFYLERFYYDDESMFSNTALANDACSRQLVAKAWEDSTAFTSAYPSWDSTGGCSPPPQLGLLVELSQSATKVANHRADAGWLAGWLWLAGGRAGRGC